MTVIKQTYVYCRWFLSFHIYHKRNIKINELKIAVPKINMSVKTELSNRSSSCNGSDTTRESLVRALVVLLLPPLSSRLSQNNILNK